MYTVHVQAGGRRFATGGIDCLVKVWSLAPVLDAQKEKAGPLVLATLSDHSSTVNTVRFSKNGKYLASGERVAGRGWSAGAAAQKATAAAPPNATAAARSPRFEIRGVAASRSAAPHPAALPCAPPQAPTTA